MRTVQQGVVENREKWAKSVKMPVGKSTGEELCIYRGAGQRPRYQNSCFVIHTPQQIVFLKFLFGVENKFRKY